VSSVSRRHGASLSQVFKCRRLVEERTMSVLGADDAVVPESEVKVLKGRIRELERLGRKTLESEVLNKASEVARETQILSRSPLPRRDCSR
jgi:hypothetical protein